MPSSFKASMLRTTGRSSYVLAVLAISGLAVSAWQAGIGHGYAAQDDKPAARAASQRDVGAPGDGARPRGVPVPSEVVEYFPLASESERKILAALDKPVDVEFQEKPLDECFHALAVQAGINIIPDRVKSEEEGVALDQPITLKLKGVRMASVLRLILEPVQLACVYENEVLKITTSSAAGDKLVTRTYPVGDLCPELPEQNVPPAIRTSELDHGKLTVRPVVFQGFGGGTPMGGMGGGGRGMGPNAKKTRFTELMVAITQTTSPDSWEDQSGPGTVVSVSSANALVIRQTEAVHREVLQLLRDLRAAKRLSQPARNAGDGPPRS
jgi:hypothetical protein